MMANSFNFTRANKNTPKESGWCQRWAEQGFGLNGLYPSAFDCWKAVPKNVKRGGLPRHDGNYYLVYFDGWFYGHRYGDVAVYRNGKVWSGSAVKWRSGTSFSSYRGWIGTPYLGWSEFCGAKRIATIAAPPKPKPKPVTPKYTTVRKGEGISHIAKRAGYKDWTSSKRWQAITNLNKKTTWQKYNASLKPGMKVRYK